MSYYYEFFEPEVNLPVKATIYELHENTLHWHKHIEILMVLAGSINKRIGEKEHLLKAGDLVFVNSNEVHNTSVTDEANLLLTIQINPEFYKAMYTNFDDFYYDCNAVLIKEPNEVIKNRARKYIAQIVKEMVKRDIGYRSKLASSLFLFTGEIFAISPLIKRADMVGVGTDDDLKRLQRIIDYIEGNLHRSISLKEIADMEHLSYYYVSHFIKDKLGMSFQEYLNQARLSKAQYLLMYSGQTFEEIAKELGFKNLNTFIKLFREKHNTTPSEYVKLFIEGHTNPNKDTLTYKKSSGLNVFYNPGDNTPKAGRTYLDVDRTNALEILFSYLDNEADLIQAESLVKKAEFNIEINALEAGEELKAYWQRLTTATRAAEGLRQEWQKQLQTMQKEIGFEQIRFHGILSDEMMIYQTSPSGEVSYNWTYVDNLFDSLLAKGIKPFVELSFMPADLKSSEQTAYWWQANTSPPNDMAKWQDLIKALVKHLINRYGLKEIEEWYFEVWNEPELELIYWKGTRQDYFEFYQASVTVIKEISPNIKVGGPSIAHQALKDSSWLEDFLTYCKSEGVPIDFISLHIYPERYPEMQSMDGAMEQLMNPDLSSAKKMQLFANMPRIYYDANNTYDSLMVAREKINEVLGYLPELCITEWNASASPRNLIHDTTFAATFIIHNVVKCIGLADMLGYWSFTDINEELPLGLSHFHGNYGLINKDGIKKASYFAYYLLGKLGDILLAKGDNYIITKNESGVQVLLYNFAYYNDLFISGDTSLLKPTDRYKVFTPKLTQEIAVQISGLAGEFKITRYQLNREHGSAYDKWVEMGAPEEMTTEAINYLKNNSYPKMTVENAHLTGEFQQLITVPVHGAELVEIRKVY